MKDQYIQVKYYNDFSIKQKTAIQSAAKLWSDIVGETKESINPAGLEIYFSSEKLDGPGSVLAQSSPFPTLLPTLGFITFDSDDLERLTESGKLLNIVKHETCHILGFGTRWEQRCLLYGKDTDNPVFTGRMATREFQELIFDQSLYVPVENTGSPGTRNSHWRESIFGNELMTGYADGNELLSKVTVASLEDLGYLVSYDHCDDFSL